MSGPPEGPSAAAPSSPRPPVARSAPATASRAAGAPARRGLVVDPDDPQRPPWLTPVLILLVAFCAGAQAAFLIQAFRGAGYFSANLLLKFTTLGLLLAGMYMLMPGSRQDEVRARAASTFSRVRSSAADAGSRLQKKATSAVKPKPAAKTSNAPASGAKAALPVKVALESPLQRGPVWPPGEPIPVTIQILVEGPGGAKDVEVEMDLVHAGGKETVRVPIRGSAAVMSQTVPVPGPFTITARAFRGGEAVAETTLEGRAAQYREEIGRRFDELKTVAAAAGLPVGPASTPRELRDALARRFPRLRAELDELVVAIEVALYSQEEVSRDTYESLVRALSQLARLGLEAAPRA